MIKISPKELSFQSISKLQQTEKDFEFDESIPDHLPNIKEVLSVDSSVIKKAILFENDKLHLNLCIKYKIYYISDNNDNLYVYCFQRETTIKTEEKKIDDIIYLTDVQLSAPIFRMLNQRKLFIKSKILLNSLKVHTHSHQSISDTQQNCCVKTVSVTSSGIVEVPSDKLSFEDTITLGDGYDPIDSILDISGTILNHSFETISGYINIKGNIALTITYKSEVTADKIIRVERQLSFEKSIPCCFNEDGYECIGQMLIEELEASTQIDSYGEYRTVNVQFTLSPEIYGIYNNYDAIVSDIFSPERSECLSTEAISYSRMLPKKDQRLSFEGAFDSNDISFNRIISSKANIVLSPKADESPNGYIEICVIGETNDGYKSVTHKKDFSEGLFSPESLVSIGSIECAVTIESASSLSYKVCGNASLLSFESEALEIINNVDFTDIPATKENLIIYYPTANEAIWDISKKYHVTPECIKANNPSIINDSTKKDEIIIIKNK